MVNISNITTKNMTFCIIIQSTQHEKHDIKHRMNLIWRCQTENKFVKILELWGDQIKTKTIRRSIQTKRLWCKNFFYVLSPKLSQSAVWPCARVRVIHGAPVILIHQVVKNVGYFCHCGDIPQKMIGFPRKIKISEKCFSGEK